MGDMGDLLLDAVAEFGVVGNRKMLFPGVEGVVAPERVLLGVRVVADRAAVGVVAVAFDASDRTIMSNLLEVTSEMPASFNKREICDVLKE